MKYKYKLILNVEIIYLLSKYTERSLATCFAPEQVNRILNVYSAYILAISFIVFDMYIYIVNAA